MAYISEMKPGSKVDLIITVKEKQFPFETEIIRPGSSKNKPYVVCKPVYSNGKMVNFSSAKVDVTVKNSEDNRIYDFVLCGNANNTVDKELYLYSLQNVKPKNYRDSYRVACGYHANIKLKDGDKIMNVMVHDISNTGISYICQSGQIPLHVGQTISTVIYEPDVQDAPGYPIVADVVRIDENWNNKVLIGARLQNGVDVSRIVAKCQRKDMRTKRN